MNCCQYPISPYPVTLRRKDLRLMVKLVRLLHKFSENRAYQALLEASLTETARLDPGHYAVMMGFDFHLSETGPKLIEVNTNAGGFWFACLGENPSWQGFDGRVGERLLASFLNEYSLFKGERNCRPSTLAIMDEHPESQFLYPEMQIFAGLFKRAGINAVIAAPERLRLGNGRLYFGEQAVDMIYNRHCDFYLQTPAMADIKKAWLEGSVCLSPNPHAYGLLADKRRMALWSDPEKLHGLGLSRDELKLLEEAVPRTRPLATLTPEQAWQSRKRWVFKPDTGYASRGVYVGNKLTASKLAQLDPQCTLLQEWVPPSLSRYDDEPPFKTDFRLFVYRNRILGVSARLYQGQVTNLRTPNGGFARVIVE